MGRLLEGFGVGVISYTVTSPSSCSLSNFNYFTTNSTVTTYSFMQVPVYIAEIAPQNMRGSLGSVNQVCFLE